MRLIVVGGGYVGISAAAVFVDRGHEVLLVERDADRAAIIASGRAPFHEPGLDDLIVAGLASQRLRVVDGPESLADSITSGFVGNPADRLIAILAVGTPAAADGSTDEHQLLEAARELGVAAARGKVRELTLVLKSTAPIGASSRVAAAASDAARPLQPLRVTTVVNPEFLRSGSAVRDFLRPDRVIVGGDDEAAVDGVIALYEGWVPNEKIIRMSDISATLVKYAANAMLATRISFMNELAALASKVGADIDEVRRGVGADARIGTEYLHAGMGYGGSCLPKDVSSLLTVSAAHGIELGIVRAAAAANARQSKLLLEMLSNRLGTLRGARIALWGLTFKGGSDDMRDSPGVALARELVAAGAHVAAYDPSIGGGASAIVDAQRSTGDEASTMELVDSAMSALHGADALAIAADWSEFRSANLEAVATAVRSKLVVDGRNIIDPIAARRAGLRYVGIGRGEAQ